MESASISASAPRACRGWVYFFSTRRKLVCSRVNNLEIITVFIHWQSLTRGKYVYAVAALNSSCRIHSMSDRRILKKHTQPLFDFFCPSNFRILDVYHYFRPSVHPSLCPSYCYFRPSALKVLAFFRFWHII